MKNRSIVLIDDHTIVRNGLKELIEKLGPYSVTAQFDSGNAFLENFPVLQKPDLVIVDLNMPGMSGFELVEHIMTLEQAQKILILTLDSDEQTIIRLFRNGVRGFLKKNCSAEMLKNALDSILATGYYHNEFLALSLRTEVETTRLSEKERILAQLTDREREFLKWVCHEYEYTYDQIADQMQVSSRTVDGYREAIFDKFAIKSKTGLVLFVLKHQLFDEL
ncbi:response regulator transcription factor [Fluviicola chungangensis]|uniref:Response regulator transcription factor n=1 Tax=Fluviicola chungangensis TaxID=2597671 RepID=A0A556MZP1_9FLAO|nr:response regulator transcription factor [Fluviicola chungangensis]TSJ45384.1 response regulator transcription factor [Fluviicola chungangensis]